jgi:NAD(P)-dependent dehydrogenase (short-subunit alcohol dehydrogenase family)
MTRRAWVAGASGGIGAACGAALRADGLQVHLSDRPDEDVCAAGVAERVGADLIAAGGIDVAVHAVGMSGRRLGDGPVSQCSDAAWDEVLRVDLTSVFRFLRTCIQGANPGASIVVIGSALAGRLDPDFLTAAYRVAKAAIIPLVEAAAFEGARRGVRVNVVAPGLVSTPMAQRALSDERVTARFSELMPLVGRPATADEIAAAVRWLASEASAQITGTVLPVDGGWSLR